MTITARRQRRATRMANTIIPLLAQFDEGITMYRRHFVPFLLISLSWFVPVAIALGLSYVYVTQREGIGILLGIFGMLVLAIPLFIYLVGGLSRAAIAADDGRPVRLRDAFAIGPRRAISMMVFTVVYYVMAQIATSMISIICICPLYLVSIFVATGLSSFSESVGYAAIALFGMAFAVIYIVLLAIGGATYSSLIYALQPWAQEKRSFGDSIQLSFDMIGYHFGRNLLAWVLSALLVTATGLSVTLAIGVVLPLPLSFVLGGESPVTVAVSATAWLLGLCVALPPLPIWMALLYRRNLAARAGADTRGKNTGMVSRNQSCHIMSLEQQFHPQHRVFHHCS